MAKMDMYNNIAPLLQISPIEYTATETPANGADLQGYESCTFIITTGNITDGTWTVTFEESDEESANFTEIAAADLIGSAPGPFTNAGSAFDEQIYKVGYIGTKRYVRCVVTMTVMGTADFSVIVERGNPHDAPTPTDLNA